MFLRPNFIHLNFLEFFKATPFLDRAPKVGDNYSSITLTMVHQLSNVALDQAGYMT